MRAAAGSERPEARWVQELARRYPGDPSVAATLLLNLVELAPGEAIQLGPGNLHAYLAGAGVELMGASDNVVRGGLTAKPVDVDDLLAVADPTPLADPVMAPAADLRLVDTTIHLLRRDGPGAPHRDRPRARRHDHRPDRLPRPRRRPSQVHAASTAYIAAA